MCQIIIVITSHIFLDYWGTILMFFNLAILLCSWPTIFWNCQFSPSYLWSPNLVFWPESLCLSTHWSGKEGCTKNYCQFPIHSPGSGHTIYYPIQTHLFPTDPSGLPRPHSCFLLHSFYAKFRHALTMWVMVSSFSLHIRHFESVWDLSMIPLIKIICTSWSLVAKNSTSIFS